MIWIMLFQREHSGNLMTIAYSGGLTCGALLAYWLDYIIGKKNLNRRNYMKNTVLNRFFWILPCECRIDSIALHQTLRLAFIVFVSNEVSARFLYLLISDL